MKQGWENLPVKNVCLVTDYVANGSFKSLRENVKYNYEKDYAILLRTTDFTKNWRKDFVYVSQGSYKFLKKSSLKVNDVVVSNVGAPGITFQVPDLGQPMTLGPNSILVRSLDYEKLTQKFIYYLFNSPMGQDLIDGITTGTTQSKFNKTNFREIHIPIPPLDEQKRIVAKLDQCYEAIDQASANVERNLQNAKELFQSQLNQIFTQKGESWVEKKLKDLCNDFKANIVDGPFGSNLKRVDYVHEGIPVLKIQNVKSFRIELKKMDYVLKSKYKELKRHSFTQNDIIMTKLGDPLGACAIVQDIDDGLIVADLVRIRAQKINTKYLCYHLNSSITNDLINSHSKGTTRPRVKIVNVRSLPIAAPSMEKQETIVQQLDQLNNQTQSLESNYQQELNALDKLKKSVLQKAFSGELTTIQNEAAV